VKQCIARLIRLASILIAALSLVLWGRSIFRTDVFLMQRLQQSRNPTAMECYREFWLESANGRFGVVLATWRDNLPHSPSRWTRILRSSPNKQLENRWIPFATWQGNPFGSMWIVSMYLPYPLVIILCAIPWLIRYRERRKLKRLDARNLCRRCGYDLRATPDRCPECGTKSPDAPPFAASRTN
jgi:hypothetical protein